MKPFAILVLLPAFLLLLTACPVSSKFPLGDARDAAPYDPALIGPWSTDLESAEVKQCHLIPEAGSNTFRVIVDIKGSSYAAEGDTLRGWVIPLEKMKFMVLQETAGTQLKNVFYVYQFDLKDKTLVIRDVSLKVKGVDAITSIPAYQEEVKASMKMEGFLSEPITYNKMTR